MSEGNLTRSDTDRMIAGVCGGIAAYLGIDSVLVRLLFVLLALASGIGVFIYIILWIVMPSDNLEDHIKVGGTPDDLGVKGQSDSDDGRKLDQSSTIGVLLIVFGAFFLLKQIGLFAWFGSIPFWVLVVVCAGIYFLVRHKRNQ